MSVTVPRCILYACRIYYSSTVEWDAIALDKPRQTCPCTRSQRHIFTHTQTHKHTHTHTHTGR